MIFVTEILFATPGKTTMMTQKHVTSQQEMKRTNMLFWFLLMATLFTAAYWYVHSNSRTPARSSLQTAFPRAYADAAPADTIVTFRPPLVLCYHQIRDWNSTDSKTAGTYIVPLQQFREQMKMLHDSGYHTILPGQWSDHLQRGAPLPGKPFLLTFDDGTEGQYSNALPELDRYGFKAVFFIMTVTLDKPEYMSSEQVRYLSDHGHLIGCHTWDHHDMTHYKDADWSLQLEQPTHLLEQLTGKPVRYFAYPFGSWNAAAIAQLKTKGYLAAYQLGGRADQAELPFTIRRMIVDGHWNASQLIKEMILFGPDKRMLQ